MSNPALTADQLGTARKDLDAQVGDRMVGPQDPGWDEARRAWNLTVDQRPVAVVRPESAQDVVAVAEVARRFLNFEIPGNTGPDVHRGGRRPAARDQFEIRPGQPDPGQHEIPAEV